MDRIGGKQLFFVIGIDFGTSCTLSKDVLDEVWASRILEIRHSSLFVPRLFGLKASDLSIES